MDLLKKILNLFLDSITCVLSAPLQSQWLKWPFQNISIQFLIFKYTSIFILVTEKTEKIFRLLFFINLYKANLILKEASIFIKQTWYWRRRETKFDYLDLIEKERLYLWKLRNDLRAVLLVLIAIHLQNQ